MYIGKKTVVHWLSTFGGLSAARLKKLDDKALFHELYLMANRYKILKVGLRELYDDLNKQGSAPDAIKRRGRDYVKN